MHNMLIKSTEYRVMMGVESKNGYVMQAESSLQSSSR